MADGLLSNVLGAIDRKKQEVKAGLGLLANNPQEWAAQATAKYFPTKEEERQFRMVKEMGGDITQTPYYRKVFDLTQFQGSLKPLSKTQFQVANEVAQKNAVDMLGLPPDNTAMDRAKAMGFNVENPVYHGTNYDIQRMNVQGKGKTSGAGAFLTNNPIVAETYVSGIGTPGGNIMPLLLKDKDLLTTNARGKNWNDIYTNQLSVRQGNKKYTLDDLELDKNSATTTDELGMIAGNLGKKGIVIKNVKDVGMNSHIFRAKEYLKEKYGVYPNEDWSNISGKQFDEARNYLDKLYKSQKSDVTAVQDPTLLRSRFAAFDPARANESDLLAAGIPIGLLGSTQVELPKKQEKKPKK
jgi:hypothetical protein